MINNSFVKTIDFGYVPVRRRFTDGEEIGFVELSDNGTNEAYASIRADYKTNQPFAVLLDDDLNELK